VLAKKTKQKNIPTVFTHVLKTKRDKTLKTYLISAGPRKEDNNQKSIVGMFWFWPYSCIDISSDNEIPHEKVS
jgi:hypothetical protein